jgi:hypothetical protein
MGWTYTFSIKTKKAMVEDCIKPQTGNGGNTKWECIAHSVRGNTLYTVFEITKEDGQKHRFIGISLLAYDRRDECWGVKDMEESMGVYEFDCPLYFFDLVPTPPNEYAKNWREKVIAKTKERKNKAATKKSIKVGDIVVLVKGCKPEQVQVVAVKPKLLGAFGGMMYRISPRHIQEVRAA